MEWFIGYIIVASFVTLGAGRFFSLTKFTPEEDEAFEAYLKERNDAKHDS